jgi:hypothetical protein
MHQQDAHAKKSSHADHVCAIKTTADAAYAIVLPTSTIVPNTVKQIWQALVLAFVRVMGIAHVALPGLSDSDTGDIVAHYAPFALHLLS